MLGIIRTYPPVGGWPFNSHLMLCLLRPPQVIWTVFSYLDRFRGKTTQGDESKCYMLSSCPDLHATLAVTLAAADTFASKWFSLAAYYQYVQGILRLDKSLANKDPPTVAWYLEGVFSIFCLARRGAIIATTTWSHSSDSLAIISLQTNHPSGIPGTWSTRISVEAGLYQSPLHENLFGLLLCGWESQANDCSLAFRSDRHNMVLARVVCVCVPRLPLPSAYRVLWGRTRGPSSGWDPLAHGRDISSMFSCILISPQVLLFLFGLLSRISFSRPSVLQWVEIVYFARRSAPIPLPHYPRLSRKGFSALLLYAVLCFRHLVCHCRRHPVRGSK
ncbi:hypothetical protein QBC46DRAFT_15176 [Diplogelasinospora grovesii]|uniref:Uncharacterized protein n=1 Tax=Diplogelasinospora grovesii TaxID=303347 RepID=A0AAN6NH31_9PEZI|nr:hypothetical protein QBC46DRAFT_15176 [Diplogelasinospora grovesii]